MPSSPEKPKAKIKEYQCLHCHKVYPHFKNFKYHFLHNHADPDADWVIASMEKEKAARAKLALKPKRFECDECDKWFGCKRTLKNHLMWKHTDKNDPNFITFRIAQNAKRQQYRVGKVKKTSVHSGSASGSAETGASSSASAVVASASSLASSPLGGAVVRCEKSGCDEVFKYSQHVAQNSVDRIGVNMRISRQSSLNMDLPRLGLPRLGLPRLGLPKLV
jgi:hypothetical protein